MGFSIGGIIGHVTHVIAPKNWAHGLNKLVHNPEASILPAHTRNSKLWHKYGRPAEKIVAAAAIGAATGGVGLVGGSVAFTGLSTAGAVTAAGVSAATGGLSSKAFQPGHDIALPAVAGFVGGNAYRYAAKSNIYSASKSWLKKSLAKEIARNKRKYTSGKYWGKQAAKLIQPRHQAAPQVKHPAQPATQQPQAEHQAVAVAVKKQSNMGAILASAGIGLVAGGPIGALVGAAVGAAVGGKNV